MEMRFGGNMDHIGGFSVLITSIARKFRDKKSFWEVGMAVIQVYCISWGWSSFSKFQGSIQMG